MTEEAIASIAGVWERIVPDLMYVRFPYPRAAIDAARAAREEITPQLLRLLDGWVADPSAAFEPDYFLHLHVIGLLAEWRETRAYRPLVALASQDEEIGEDLFGDASGEMLDRALASVCDGDEEPLCELARNASLSIWLRIAAIDALVVRAVEGDAELASTRASLWRVGQSEADRLRAGNERDSTMLAFVVAALADLGPREAMPEVRQWYRDGLPDESVVNLDAVERGERLADEELLAEARRSGKRYVTDSADLFSGWHCFSKEYWDRRAAGLDDDDEGGADFDDDLELQLPYVRAEPKVGRNDPCPCGSGKKYKKCHGAA